MEEDPYADYPMPSEDNNNMKCPYLSQINRKALDFDMQKVCSVTLSNQNVYCCLVCGKFFSGRGQGTPVHTHSVQHSHFVFINLHSTKIYTVPDNYEVVDSSLDDIKYCLSPTFSASDLQDLSRSETLSHDVSGTAYLPGFVGMNNLNCTDCINAVLHALAHVQPIRDFFLVPSNYATSQSGIVHKFGAVLRKMWSRGNFKSTVSPHDFVHEVNVSSKGRFRVGQQSQVVDFFSWLLNALDKGLTKSSSSAGSKKRPRDGSSSSSSSSSSSATASPSVIHAAFQGQIHVTTRQEGTRETESDVACMYMTLNIPPRPLFEGADGEDVHKATIPEIPLYELLKKMDGSTWTDAVSTKGLTKRRYKIKKLPTYLILNLERFTKTKFALEKNPTVVTFPVKNLDMSSVMENASNIGNGKDVDAMSTKELRELVQASSSPEAHTLLKAALEKPDLVRAARAALAPPKYDLVASICHDSSTHKTVGARVSTSDEGLGKGKKEDTSATAALEMGAFKTHLCHRATGQWFEISDLSVRETMPQLVGMSESNLLIYERQ